MDNKARRRMLAECRAILEEFGVNVNLYDMGHIWHDPKRGGNVFEVTFKSAKLNKSILITEVMPDDDGSIMVAGSHYNRLEF